MQTTAVTGLEEQDAVEVPRFVDTDPLKEFFRKRNLGPLAVFFWVLVFNLLTNVIPAIAFDAWDTVSATGPSGLKNEPGAWAIFGLAQPAILAFYVWLVPAGERMVQYLFTEGNIIANSETVSILKTGVGRLQGRWLKTCAIVVAILIQALVILLEKGVIGDSNPTWINVNLFVFSLRSIVAVVVYYALAYIVFYAIVIIHTQNNLMRSGYIHVKAYHPDKAGGFGVVGQFVTSAGFLVAAMGGTIAVLYLQAYEFAGQFDGSWLIAAILATVAYFVLAPALFFLLLNSTHRAMVKYRDGLLRGLSDDIEQAYQEMYGVLTNGLRASDEQATHLKQLEQLYLMTSKFPAWPLNTAMLRKYYSLTAAPVVSFFIAVFLLWIDSKYFSP